MSTTRFLLVVASFAAASSAAADEVLRRQALTLFGRIEAAAPAVRSAPEVELGRALFWDPRLSSDGKTACASCHFARDWGADRRRFSIDARGAATSRHSPTVFNAMSQQTLRWLGDRKSGADQAEGSLTGSMGFASKQAGLELLAQLDYLAAFRAAFPQDAEPLSARNYGRALEAYQATLTTPAPFDRFLAGEDGALTGQQKAGLRARSSPAAAPAATADRCSAARCCSASAWCGTIGRRLGRRRSTSAATR